MKTLKEWTDTCAYWNTLSQTLEAARQQSMEEYDKTYAGIKTKLLYDMSCESASKLLMTGLLKIEDIAEYTGLSVDDVIYLKSSMLHTVERTISKS